MTHTAIFKTKKAFKEAVDTNSSDVFLRDPSLFYPTSGSVSEIMKKESLITVTNHPKRSWFAEVKKVNGEIKVS